MILSFQFHKPQGMLPDKSETPCLLLESFEGRMHLSVATYYKEVAIWRTDLGNYIYPEDVIGWSDISDLHGQDPTHILEASSSQFNTFTPI